jgi:catechol 2,3-dioxygenase-like lactoylglutathione lyase family enzyme
MTINLNHTIIPARNKKAAAQFFAHIFGLHADLKRAILRRYASTTRSRSLFDDEDEFESHHYAFHVSDAEFDAIFGRIREAKFAYGWQRTVEPRGRQPQ